MSSRALALTLLAACWTSSHPADPPRWRTAPTAELLPAGAWFAAAIDLDGDVKPHAPPVKKDGGCQITALSAAVAGYNVDDFAFVARGPVQRDAMLDCLASVMSASSRREIIGGREMLVLTNEKGTTQWLVTGGERGFVLGASPDVMTRATAPDLTPAIADPRLGPLIARARAGGQFWAAMLVPAGSRTLRDLLAMLHVSLTGGVRSAIFSARFGKPYQLDIVIELERADDAAILARTLESMRIAARDRSGKGLGPILDAITVKADGTHVTLVSFPAEVDWMAVVADVAAIVAQVRSHE